jgi:hypothetical protein
MSFIFSNPDVEAVFDQYPLPIRGKILEVRQLIFDVAAELPEVGPLEETLKWGEPSYIPSKTKSGSMVRVHHHPSKPFDYGVYFICSTTLVDTFRELYPNTFTFNKNRCLEFMCAEPIPVKELKHCIKLALTYYLND